MSTTETQPGIVTRADCVQAVLQRRVPDRIVYVTEKTIRTRAGTLTERLRYIFNESTLVQEKPLLDNFAEQSAAFEAWVRGRRWRFNRATFGQWQQEVGDDGLINAGELFSPLKMLHLAARPGCLRKPHASGDATPAAGHLFSRRQLLSDWKGNAKINDL